ncbi:MAG: hypothetical protein ACTSWQ_02260 [Candidatus Thorarchaeota archaeon]
MKGQIKQVFIWGMMIILIGFVMIIALQSFGRIDETRCSAEKIQFQSELNRELEENYVWGREKVVTLRKPCGYEAMCFVDNRNINNDGTTGDTLTEFDDMFANGFDLSVFPKYNQDIIKDSVIDQIEMNIFLLKKDIVEPYAYNEKIVLPVTPAECNPDGGSLHCPTANARPEYAFCIPSKGGNFKFKLEGQGRTIMIRAVE